MTRVFRHLDALTAATVVAVGLAVAVPHSAFAAAMEEPAKPADTKPADPKSDKKPDAKTTTNPGRGKADDAKPAGSKPAPDKKSEQDFRDGYKQAYALIYRANDYAGGITALRALGHDDHPDVANLIGFSSRKLGRVEDAKLWYEKALAADPKHTRTWQYYGMWHLEQGNRLKAEDHLHTIKAICGADCEDYKSLQAALNGSGTY